MTGTRSANVRRSGEAGYREFFQAVDEGLCIIQVIFDGDRPVDYRFLDGNPAWERHSGLVGAIGRTAREVLPDLEDHWFEIYGRVARTREPIRFESRSDVMERWFDVYAFPFDEPASGKVALLFRDVSTQRKTAAALAESRERFRAVLENALDAAYRRDLQTDTYDYLSPRVREVLGIDPDVMRTMPVADFVDRMHPDDRPRIFQAIEDGVRSAHGRVEYRFLDDDGEYRWLADHFTVQSDADGVPLYRTGIVRDITEQKAAEAELEDARRTAEEASQAKSRFLAVMSHELRTPLSGVIGFADLMETEVLGPTTSRQQESLASIKASAWHLIGIIDEILTLSRADAGVEAVRWQDADLAELVREVVRTAWPRAAERGLELTSVGAAEPAPFRTDPGKLRQILINLVGNAVKYTDEGQVTVRLDRSAPDALRVQVEDTGAGIPAPELERIFEPFTQVDSTLTREATGTGLGLAICRRLARLMGGDVTVVSRVGEGSTFTLTLPVRPAG
jgi:PAS domain S-box-containing protein